MIEYLTPLFYALLKWLAIFIFVYYFLSYIIRVARDFGNVHSHWHHTFEDFHFSPKEFYKAVEEEIKKKKIENLSVSTMTMSSSRGFSTDRLYMRVQLHDQMYLICAAPFGTDFFISLRFGETMTFLRDLISRIPRYGLPLERFIYRKTYFEEDSDDMFEETVRECAMKVIKSITDGKGIRGLSELDRKPHRTLSLSA